MKQLRKFFTLTLLLFTVSIQFAAAQSIESQWRDFFNAKNQLAYRTICRLAHPTNTFVSGSMYIDGGYFIVTIHSEDYTLKVRLHKSNDRFDSIEKISDNDWAPTWVFSNIIKSFANDMYENYHSDVIARIERMYGQRLYDMNAKQMTLAALTLQLWVY